MAQVAWSQAALDDLAAIRAFIAEENPGAAAAIAAELIGAGDSLDELPFRGVPVIRGRRKLIIGNV
ncbi:MAG: type II toxin-antitoxin system RelE/ParE family toxin [Stellaceae bacterium]